MTISTSGLTNHYPADWLERNLAIIDFLGLYLPYRAMHVTRDHHVNIAFHEIVKKRILCAVKRDLRNIKFDRFRLDIIYRVVTVK